MNSLNDPSEFQEVESNYSRRLSYVSSQPAMISSSHSMLSLDKRLPLDTWNTSGSQENVFGNQSSTVHSSRDHPQGIHSCATPRETGSVPQATGNRNFVFTRDEKHKFDTNICKKAVYIWIQGKRFGTQFSALDSHLDHFQGIHPCAPQRERVSVPQATGTFFTRDDEQNEGTIPMPTFATRPLTTSSSVPVEFPQNSMVGPQ